ncbi:hypothetical protein [Mesorhizobium sp. B2-6-4]|uniref:hypothetical protein n=1 Tax=Mesorhizobium sp. B2-6-4 TaxID=2589913 RepID=UPI0015E3DE11|nr:hypothetical protein [Mesorhizobium sp. B2-6-4]
MKQLLSDLAAMTEPGFCIALGLLALPYAAGVFVLIRHARASDRLGFQPPYADLQ